MSEVNLSPTHDHVISEEAIFTETCLHDMKRKSGISEKNSNVENLSFVHWFICWLVHSARQICGLIPGEKLADKTKMKTNYHLMLVTKSAVSFCLCPFQH